VKESTQLAFKMGRKNGRPYPHLSLFPSKSKRDRSAAPAPPSPGLVLLFFALAFAPIVVRSEAEEGVASSPFEMSSSSVASQPFYTCGDSFRVSRTPLQLIEVNGTSYLNSTEVLARLADAKRTMAYYKLLLTFNEPHPVRTSPDSVSSVSSQVWSADALWILFSAFLVFFMQAGFGMLEVGAVAAKNSKNILVKNLFDVALCVLTYFWMGWDISFGSPLSTHVGNGSYLSWAGQIGSNSTEYPRIQREWMFQFAFAATAATIVSGAMAERTQFKAYVIISFVVSTFIYPITVHWMWSSTGLLSPSNSANEGFIRLHGGAIDFAGSGVVHMTGGAAALVGAAAVGSRAGRFARRVRLQEKGWKKGKGGTLPHGHNLTTSTLGTLILWFGWYGFNAGSTLTMSNGLFETAARITVVTTVGGSSGCIAAVIASKIREGEPLLVHTLNGLLAGLVSITAGCSVLEPWAAVIVGALGGAVYFFSSIALKHPGLEVDDPLDASPIHFFGGMWGLIAVGLFAEPTFAAVLYRDGVVDPQLTGLVYGGDGTLLVSQFAAAGLIASFALSISIILFLIMKSVGMLRIDDYSEVKGLDSLYHGGLGYADFMSNDRDILMKNPASLMRVSNN